MSVLLLQGNALKIPIADKSIDLIVTSPPYNVGKDYADDVDDSRDYEDYLDWLDTVWNECYRVLVSGGRLCINVNDQGRAPVFPIHADVTVRLKRKWLLLGTIIWDKMTPLSNTAWGSWESASSPSLRGRHEFIIIVAKESKRKLPRIAESCSGPWYNAGAIKDFLTLTTEIWKFTPETQSNHPAPFPRELPARCIKLFSFIGDVVFDPFCGFGTTLRAAKDLGRLGIGMDIVRKYVVISRKRVAQELLPNF